MGIYDILTQYQQAQTAPFAALQQGSPAIRLPNSAAGTQSQVNQSMVMPTIQGGLNAFAANNGVAYNSPSRVAAASFAVGNAAADNLNRAAGIKLDAQRENAAAALNARQSLNNEMMSLMGLNQDAYNFNSQVAGQQQGNLLQMLSPFVSAMQDYGF